MTMVTLLAGVLLAAVAVATGEWVYLLYSVPVAAAALFWHPSWRTARLPRSPTLAGVEVDQALRAARRQRAVLLAPWVLSVLLMGYALRRVIVAGDSLVATALATALAFALTLWLVRAQRRVEGLEHG